MVTFKLFFLLPILFLLSGCVIDMSLLFTDPVDYELVTPISYYFQSELCNTNLSTCMHFIFEIDTRLGDGFSSFVLPLTNDGIYDFHVFWGDGTYNHITSFLQFLEFSHSYSEAGIYQIELIGHIEGFNFNQGFSNDAQKVTNIIKWGGIRVGNQGAYFRDTINMKSIALDSPNLKNTTNLSQMFYNSHKFNQDIGHWNVSQVKEMDKMFHSALKFDQNLRA